MANTGKDHHCDLHGTLKELKNCLTQYGSFKTAKMILYCEVDVLMLIKINLTDEYKLQFIRIYDIT